jgi:2-amino-4-hydroxy-6-hydroxymethyldihydropteridine diphosphokinase
MIIPVGIALGSNLGDRAAEMNAGIAFLQSLSAHGRIRESSRMMTAPVGCPPGSESFLNAFAEIEVEPEIMPPRKLLRQLQDFEMSRGRLPERGINAPRPLDLDIIYYGDRVIHDRELIVPHPRAMTRRFVLEPLSHLHPDLILPGQTKTIGQLLDRVISMPLEQNK